MNSTFVEIAAIVAILAVLVGFVWWVSENATQNDEAFRAACAERGGVVLENTRVTGKTTSVSRACIKQDVLVNTEEPKNETAE